ncbi:hypothetical protein MARPU_01305 [Marichromatium purpuratum 984]|uniref:Uncharacterized protein n=1 Tax=Marichromatium purpuratum 984 TaxID=765910 RepID=W0E3L5_MARPU|nr:hypothetical protein MARPU_01305 [Marichromatium purpuratum 984]
MDILMMMVMSAEMRPAEGGFNHAPDTAAPVPG